MSLSRLILIGALLLPAAEIACFVAVAGAIGVAQALLLLLSLSAWGALMVRRAGAAQLAALRRQFDRSGRREVALGGRGLVSIAAGILLLLPGFITAALGVALIALPTRWLGWVLARVFEAARQPRRRARRAPPVIDLERTEWHVEPAPDRTSPNGSKR